MERKRKRSATPTSSLANKKLNCTTDAEFTATALQKFHAALDGIDSQKFRFKHVVRGVLTSKHGLINDASTCFTAHDLKLPLPLSTASVDQLLTKLKSKTKGKTKKMLKLESEQKIFNVNMDTLSFSNNNNTETESNDLWYDIVYDSVIESLKKMDILEEYLRKPVNPSGNDTAMSIELSKCLLLSEGNTPQEHNCYQTIMDRKKMANEGEQFFATFIVQFPLLDNVVAGHDSNEGFIRVSEAQHDSVFVLDKATFDLTVSEMGARPFHENIDRYHNWDGMGAESSKAFDRSVALSRWMGAESKKAVFGGSAVGEDGAAQFLTTCFLNNCSYNLQTLIAHKHQLCFFYDIIYTPIPTTDGKEPVKKKKKKGRERKLDNLTLSIDDVIRLKSFRQLWAPCRPALLSPRAGRYFIRVANASLGRWYTDQCPLQALGALASNQLRVLTNLSGPDQPLRVLLACLKRTLTGDLYDDDDDDWHRDMSGEPVPGRSLSAGVEHNTEKHRKMCFVNHNNIEFTRIVDMHNNSIDVRPYNELYFDGKAAAPTTYQYEGYTYNSSQDSKFIGMNDGVDLSLLRADMVPPYVHPFTGKLTDYEGSNDSSTFAKLGYISHSTLDQHVVEYMYYQYMFILEY